MKTWRKLSLRRCQNESNCGAWISTLSQTLLKEWNAAVEAFLKQKKRKKPLSILRKNSINLFPWKKKQMPYTTVFMKMGGRRSI